ncbi:hypothetical protein BCB4_0211 [Bacillus phage B4]|uniref:Uncharacterized protein n=2 Tax=Bequatrovirus B4 TaxID=1918005 RepID=J9PRI3_9CAUD|nr:hypothetical protein BCB4_0211 [Bacillus phage B4]YP_009783801.1 hypothetical protein QLX26_gp205 [Bacillus phage B5S]MEB9013793.1 hypothetical protein [Bacillus cereus]AEW47439.1 hypothetical protein B5S_0205 [Bacillus phage B5S]AEZ66004.1 hypothetical protein BCB4_0211 [Bacillus phage B4]MEB9190592.1 hypothetical protein [Bacillus cereus]
MECNNKYCVWNMFDQCCPDSEERFNEATPNELDCPASVREDLQNGVYETYNHILSEIDEMCYDDRLKVLIFMLEQRDEDIDLDKALEIIHPGALIYMYGSRRNLRELLATKKFISNLNKPIKRPWQVEILPDDASNLKSVSGARPSLSEMTEENWKWISKQK